MKKRIRKGVFETNSSSTHSLAITTIEEFEKWKNGDLIYDTWNNEFVTLKEAKKNVKVRDDETPLEAVLSSWHYQTYEQFNDDYMLERFERNFTTPSGDKMVAFGKFGYDG